MNKLFNVGDIIYGFCNGHFGRDDYDEKLCIMVTKKYAIFQYLDGEFKGNAAVLNNPEQLQVETVQKWKENE